MSLYGDIPRLSLYGDMTMLSPYDDTATGVLMELSIRTPTELGAAVRQARRDLGLSQQELAARARVSRQWLSELEGGKRTAELGLVLRVLHTADALVTVHLDASEATERDRRVDLGGEAP